MEPSDDPFRPKQIDEQIEWPAQHTQEEMQEGSRSTQLVQRLRRVRMRTGSKSIEEKT